VDSWRDALQKAIVALWRWPWLVPHLKNTAAVSLVLSAVC